MVYNSIQVFWAYAWRYLFLSVVAMTMLGYVGPHTADSEMMQELGNVIYLPVAFDMIAVYYILAVKHYRNFAFRTGPNGTPLFVVDTLLFWLCWRWRFVFIFIVTQVMVTLYMAFSLQQMTPDFMYSYVFFALVSITIQNYLSLCWVMHKLVKKKKLALIPQTA